MSNNLLVTLTTSDLRSLIAEVIDEKMRPQMEHVTKPDEPRPVYSRLEVAALFGVSRTTIDKWRRHRILPPSFKISSRVYFYKDQIKEFLKRRERNPELFNNL
jgi:predicted DNA-binding transcriptional regulator AlpA